MKKVWFFPVVVALFLITSIAKGQFKQPFKWSYRTNTQVLTVSVAVPAGTYLYKESTTLTVTNSEGKQLPLDQAPDSETYKDDLKGDIAVFKGKKIFEWVFAVSGKPPYKIDIRFLGCQAATKDAPAQCFMQGSEIFTVNQLQPSQKELEKKQAAKKQDDKLSTLSVLPEKARNLIKTFKIAQSKSGVIDKDEFIGFLKHNENTDNLLAGKSMLIVILIILAGGLGLNLTPCVLPMIPINLAIIGAGLSAKSRFSGFLRGGIYGLGIAVAYGTLGLLVILTGAKFGTLNSMSWFNFAIAFIFIVLGLAMFDIFSIDLSRYSSKLGPSENSKGKLFTAFVMGIIAALLAGACVAPVVIAVLLHSASLYSSGVYAGLLLPFLLGVGMALPWPFAGGGLSFLPKPGKWMMYIKKGFGIFIILMAINYGIKGVSLLPKPAASGGYSPDTSLNILITGLEKAKKENKPVMIDFWATWCTNCKAMDQTTLSDPEVKDILNNDYVFIKFQAENLDDARIKAILDHYKVIGLPTFITLE